LLLTIAFSWQSKGWRRLGPPLNSRKKHQNPPQTACRKESPLPTHVQSAKDGKSAAMGVNPAANV
jgi:hypothetical protein